MLYQEDKNLKYDLTKHEYYITPQYFLDRFGVDLNTISAVKEDINPATAAQRFLKLIGEQLYQYIYEYAANKTVIQYLIATDYNDFREAIMDALGLYAYSIYLSGNLVQLDTFLTLDNGKEIDAKDIKIQMMPVGVKNILETAGILWRGTYRDINVEELKALKVAGEF